MRTIAIITLIMCGACSPQKEGSFYPKPQNLVPEKTYIKILSDLYFLQSWEQNGLKEEQRDSLQLILFREHNITKENYWESHRYYQSSFSKHSQQLDSVVSILNAQKIPY